MRYFLVDYENVQSGSPFCGIDMLNAEDEIFVFYSECAKKMGEYYWQLLISNSCKKHFVKLKQPGKNALDFYIAVQVGNCIGKNQNAEIAIISNDKDYTAVIDYVKQIEKTKAQHVVIASSVIEAMSILGVPREKRNQVIAKMNSMVTIDPNYKLITNIEADKDKRDTQLVKKVRRLHKQRWHLSLREILCLRKA